jgi:hypothetical protein
VYSQENVREYRMAGLFQEIWHWTVELVPVVIGLAIYFVPSFLRQWKNFVYTPLYFAFYPLSHVKRDVVHKYVGSTYFAPFLADENEADKLKNKTTLVVGASAILDTVILPVCLAFVWSLFFNTAQFIIALVLLLLIQGGRFLTSFSTVQKHLYGTVMFRGWLACGYTTALIVIAWSMAETQRWVTASLVQGNYLQLFWKVADLLWSLVPMAIVSALIAAIINLVLLNKKVRQENLYAHQKPNNTQSNTAKHPHSKRSKSADKK